jgi:hypothetical protein
MPALGYKTRKKKNITDKFIINASTRRIQMSRSVKKGPFVAESLMKKVVRNDQGR